MRDQNKFFTLTIITSLNNHKGSDPFFDYIQMGQLLVHQKLDQNKHY